MKGFALFVARLRLKGRRCRVAKTHEECERGIQEALGRFNEAVSKQRLAHQNFIMHSQLFDWEQAEVCRLAASALYEAQMDAFTEACHLSEKAKNA